MKNLCNNCGKCSDELDGFGYCPKCSKKLFGQSKHTTVEQVRIKNKIKAFSVLVIILICISVAIYYRNNILEFIALSTETTSSNTIINTVQAVINTEDKILTKIQITYITTLMLVCIIWLKMVFLLLHYQKSNNKKLCIQEYMEKP